MKVLSVKDLSKLYYLGDRLPNSLRDTIAGVFSSRRSTKDELWALKDVSFELSDGETLGIVGSNGAGKSTLLKVLSRITKPTKGQVEIRGRVGSLLEVGTGFHNELSGRENIYLNGAILGMKRAEILKKFDEIVEFSEIERFLDTPLKHYSSGMYMRLAFAVAAHLDPEILIVDEVLAVGDVGFQKKCLSKMRDIGESGRTILFVSHDMRAVARLCSRVVWLDKGKVRGDGQSDSVIAEYLHEQTNISSVWKADESNPTGNDHAKLISARVIGEDRQSIQSLDIRKSVGIEMIYEVRGDKVITPNIHFFDESGTCIFVSHDWYGEWKDKARPAGTYRSIVWVPGNFFSEGRITVAVAASTYEPMEVHFVVWDALSFYVTDSIDGDSARGDYTGQFPGVVRPILDWETTND